MDFFSGLAQSLQGLPDEIGKLQEMARARKAAAALANSDFSNVGGPQPQPQPAPHPAAALAAMSQQPPAPPASRPMMRPPAAPQPQTPPQMQPRPDPNLSATAQPGMDFGNPIREANQTWSSIINSIKRANPKIDPVTLVAAAKDQLENIKGIAPLTKSIMDAQIKGQEFAVNTQLKLQRLQQLGDEVGIRLMRANSDEERNSILREWHQRQTAIEQGRADTYADSVEYAHEDRQSAETGRNTRSTADINSRERIAQGRNETQKDISGQRSSDSRYRADQGFRGAQVRSGAPAGPTPAQTPGLPPDARRAPDGHWYAKRNGRYVRFD